MTLIWRAIASSVALLPAWMAWAGVERPLAASAVTFTDDQGAVYVLARQASAALGLSYEYDPRSDLAFLGSIPLDHDSSVSGQHFVRLSSLSKAGATLQDLGGGQIRVRLGEREMVTEGGVKSAVVRKGKQRMDVYQGGRLLFTSRVSTGKARGSTPRGAFRIGPIRDRYKTSSKYGDAPMPWAVHVTRNIFVHGGPVPNYPASHGCIRLPMDVARWFYRWAEPGTVVRIVP